MLSRRHRPRVRSHLRPTGPPPAAELWSRSACSATESGPNANANCPLGFGHQIRSYPSSSIEEDLV